MPRSIRCTFPIMSLSISMPSKDWPMRLPTIPGYEETSLQPASAAEATVSAFS